MFEVLNARGVGGILEAAHRIEESLGSAQLWFRGHACNEWALVPTAHRRHPILEAQFANNFRLRAPTVATKVPAHKDYAAWLPLMQHYGLPTRLLDWTESLLVAAYFAVLSSDTVKNPVIWCLSPGALNLPTFDGVIPFLNHPDVEPIVEAAFKSPSVSENASTFAVLAPRSDLRMAAQLGNYSLHGSRVPLNKIAGAEDSLGCIHISPEAIDHLRRDLLITGLRRSTLFPDLANLASELAALKAFGPDDEDLEGV